MPQPNRNYKDPIYRKWRDDVKRRDGYKCQMPGCESNKRLQVHHIKTWSKHPALRYDVANGITLCAKCHREMKNKEEDYEHLCNKILEWNFMDKVEIRKRRKRK